MKSRSLALADQPQGHWITRNGAHVFIAGDAQGGVKQDRKPHNVTKAHPEGDVFGGPGREIGARPGAFPGKPTSPTGKRSAAITAANKKILDALPKAMSIAQQFKEEDRVRKIKLPGGSTSQEAAYPQMFHPNRV
jgi:hypothetical protein